MKIRYTHDRWGDGMVCIRAEVRGFRAYRLLTTHVLDVPMAVRYEYRLLRRELRRYLKDAP